MARYKGYDYRQGKFIPVSFDKQILPGTFEYTLNYLIDNELDLSVFDDRYRLISAKKRNQEVLICGPKMRTQERQLKSFAK
ncbi:MAG: hypothetical protein A4E65_03739 [Syntrophorhabdus sp. PtaU1.Bin153]|nr:MAG: hypothetical protein A4E65_03739 [Syntrophorhabdus sp. PtaU1.Bin153]